MHEVLCFAPFEPTFSLSFPRSCQLSDQPHKKKRHRHPGTLQVEGFAREIHLCLDHRIEVAPETGHIGDPVWEIQGDPRSTETWG